MAATWAPSTVAPARPARISWEALAVTTRGEDDDNGWNDYKSLTVGANVYYSKVRGSIAILYGESREPIETEDEGIAVNARIQYLF